MPRPSFGCATCRRRRIKCDERPGGCSQCERYGVTCPLYPDSFDVLLRQHAAGVDTPGRSVVPLGRSDGPSRNPQAHIGPESIHPYQLQPDAEEMALGAYYNNNCVDGGTRWTVERTKALGNGCLFAAILTLSKVQIDQNWSLPGGANTWMESYTNAIHLLNAALADNSLALEDNTLLATQILSAVEMKAAPNRSTDYWLAHTQGAAALLHLRGPNQITTQMGAALFFQVTTDLATSCLLGKRRLPSELWEMRNAMREQVVDASHPVWKYQGAMFQFTDFYAANQAESYDTQSIQAILAEALDIYDNLVSVFKGADAVWMPRRVSNARAPDILNYQLDYQTVLAAQLWNGYRVAVILLYTIVARVHGSLSPNRALDPNVKAFVENAPTVLNETALDTIAAVPPGVERIRSRQIARADPSSICENGYSSHTPVFQERITSSLGLPYMHGCLIQWAVYFGAQSQFIEPERRKRLWQILDSAAEIMQVRQWKILAEELRVEMQTI